MEIWFLDSETDESSSLQQPHHQIPIFSLQDMRFFQHFLLQCYPHHPIGNENIWTHEVPYLSQSVSERPCRGKGPQRTNGKSQTLIH